VADSWPGQHDANDEPRDEGECKPPCDGITARACRGAALSENRDEAGGSRDASGRQPYPDPRSGEEGAGRKGIHSNSMTHRRVTSATASGRGATALMSSEQARRRTDEVEEAPWPRS